MHTMRLEEVCYEKLDHESKLTNQTSTFLRFLLIE